MRLFKVRDTLGFAEVAEILDADPRHLEVLIKGNRLAPTRPFNPYLGQSTPLDRDSLDFRPADVLRFIASIGSPKAMLGRYKLAVYTEVNRAGR
jgi:hypothetical protein